MLPSGQASSGGDGAQHMRQPCAPAAASQLLHTANKQAEQQPVHQGSVLLPLLARAGAAAPPSAAVRARRCSGWPQSVRPPRLATRRRPRTGAPPGLQGGRQSRGHKCLGWGLHCMLHAAKQLVHGCSRQPAPSNPGSAAAPGRSLPCAAPRAQKQQAPCTHPDLHIQAGFAKKPCFASPAQAAAPGQPTHRSGSGAPGGAAPPPQPAVSAPAGLPVAPAFGRAPPAAGQPLDAPPGRCRRRGCCQRRRRQPRRGCWRPWPRGAAGRPAGTEGVGFGSGDGRDDTTGACVGCRAAGCSCTAS